MLWRKSILILFLVPSDWSPPHPSDGDGPLRTVALSGPKVPLPSSLFPLFMYVGIYAYLPLSRHVYPYYAPLFFVFYFAELTRRYAHVGRRVHAHIDTVGRVLRTVAASAVSNSTVAARPEIPGVRIPSRPSAACQGV